jgi:hypothetical protein
MDIQQLNSYRTSFYIYFYILIQVLPLRKNIKIRVVGFRVYTFKIVKEPNVVRHWWLTAVILAAQETEIRRITVQSHSWANSS